MSGIESDFQYLVSAFAQAEEVASFLFEAVSGHGIDRIAQIHIEKISIQEITVLPNRGQDILQIRSGLFFDAIQFLVTGWTPEHHQVFPVIYVLFVASQANLPAQFFLKNHTPFQELALPILLVPFSDVSVAALSNPGAGKYYPVGCMGNQEIEQEIVFVPGYVFGHLY
jgi:hypothetical protein